MSDLISREALIESLEKEQEIYENNGAIPSFWTALSVVRHMPTIEAKPVVHGEWRHIGGDEWCCSECGNVISTEGSWEKPTGNFCEECGADMRKKV